MVPAVHSKNEDVAYGWWGGGEDMAYGMPVHMISAESKQ